MSTGSSKKSRLSKAGVALASLALVAGGAITATAAPGPSIEYFWPGDAPIGTDYATGSDILWTNAGWSGGSVEIDDIEIGGESHGPGLTLTMGTSSSVVQLYRTFGPAVNPTDLPALLENASYTYFGDNVNFQIAMFFEPKDSQYGPSGASACRQATELGIDIPGWCFTVLKWEPYQRPDVWTTVPLDPNSAGHSASSTGGWINTQRVGSYPLTASSGQTIPDYLAQMADYKIYAFGPSIGSGTSALTGYVQQFTIGGTQYLFDRGPVSFAVKALPGTVRVGQTLSAQASSALDGSGIVYDYQWLRGGAVIVGATGSSYNTVAADVGKRISVKVTATHPDRSPLTLEVHSGIVQASTPAPSSSSPDPVVDEEESELDGPGADGPPLLVLLTVPAINGEAVVGQSLTAVLPQVGVVEAELSFGYQWLRDGQVIAGATGADYTVTTADFGAVLSVQVTIEAEGILLLTSISDATEVVTMGQIDFEAVPSPAASGAALGVRVALSL